MSRKKKPTQKHYTLYLDESVTFNSINNTRQNEHLCLAGIIVPDDDYEQLEAEVNCLKQKIWGEYQNPDRIILHQKSITDAEEGRLDEEKFPRV